VFPCIYLTFSDIHKKCTIVGVNLWMVSCSGNTLQQFMFQGSVDIG
jgi:hypothetical protein